MEVRPAGVCQTATIARAYRVKGWNLEEPVEFSVPSPVEVEFTFSVVAVADKTMALYTTVVTIIDDGALGSEFLIEHLLPIVNRVLHLA